MAINNLVTESREVRNFDRVTLTMPNIECELLITQSESESLCIKARQEILSRIRTEVRNGKLAIWIDGSWSERIRDALTTSLTRPRIRCHLTLKTLTSLEGCGTMHVSASGLETDRLALGFSGAGNVQIEQLAAKLLTVNLQGIGAIELAGEVAEQQITVAGAGHYRAPGLVSKRASVKLNGIGRATVWVLEDLEVSVRGPGSVEYRGTPRVRKNLAPLGIVTCLADA